MDLIDRYLNAVAAQLPQDERVDITAELRDLILSRFEAKEEELGRALTEDEQETILREIGHPLVVAARYRKGPDSLVGPELFPYWLFGVKAGLMVLGGIYLISLAVHLLSSPAQDSGQIIAQAFHGFFGAGLTLIGAATLAAAIFEHQGIRPAFLTKWRVQDLNAFGLSDPSAWGAAMGANQRKRSAWGLSPPRSSGMRGWPGSEAVFSLIAGTVFVLWWVGAIHFPGLMSIELRGGPASVEAAPIWTTLFGPILAYALAGMAVDLFNLLQPHATRMRAAATIPLAAAGLWLTWAILQAGHWFTLSQGGEAARIVGGTALLNFQTLNALGDGGRDLASMAATLSVVFTWVLAGTAISLAFKVMNNLVRLARG